MYIQIVLPNTFRSSSNQVGDIKKDDLPGPEGLEQPGRKDQDVRMIRVGNVVEAHMVCHFLYISMYLLST